jgi:hypothetical protein
VNVEWTTRRAGERTLVEVTLTSERPREVRVEPTGEPTLYPPRTDGVVDAGWDEEGFEGCVDGRRGLGFATGDPPGDPPVRVDWGGPPTDDGGFEGHSEVPTVEASADGVVRTLSEPRPPEDAVPVRPATDPGSGDRPAVDRDGTDGEAASDGRGAGVGSRGDGRAGADEEATGERDGPTSGGESASSEVDATEPDGADPAPGGRDPPGTGPGTNDDPSAGLDALERRVALAERLAGAETLGAAGEAVATAGGLAGVRALEGELARDRERLRTLAARVDRLEERARRVEVPTATLARIAGEEP